MLWIICFIIIVIISFVLAVRSMKNFQKVPISLTQSHGLFLIRNKKALNINVFQQLTESIEQTGEKFFSLEHLFKGKEAVLAIFGPRQLIETFPELELIEIEDYLERIDINDTYPWVIEAKNNHKKILNIKPEFLKMIDLTDDQQFFWQIVCSPLKGDKKQGQQYQVSVRAMMVDKNPVRKIETAKKIDVQINDCTGLMKKPHQPAVAEIYKAFKVRYLTPKEATPFYLEQQEVLQLMGIN